MYRKGQVGIRPGPSAREAETIRKLLAVGEETDCSTVGLAAGTAQGEQVLADRSEDSTGVDRLKEQ